MSIVKMRQLRLVGLRQERQALLRLLQRLGCVEIDAVEAESSDPDWAEWKVADGAALSRARERGEAGERALEVLKRYAPKQDRGRTVALTEQELFDPKRLAQGEQTIRAVLEEERNLTELRAGRADLEGLRQELAPWLELDVPLDVPSTRAVTVRLGTLPNGVDVDALQNGLREEPVRLICVSSDGERHYLLLLYHNGAEQAVSAMLKEAGWLTVPPRDWTGTARENEIRVHAELEEITERIAQAEQKLKAWYECRAQVQQVVDHAAVDADREAGASRLLDTRNTFFLRGWIPVTGEEAVRQALDGFTCAFEVRDPDPRDYETVPVKLKNNWFTRPLNLVTDMYVYPAYDGLDPNPLMAPFFILFFGLMMADMAYGLLMLLGGWYLLKRKRAKGAMGHMGGLLVLCGVSAFAFGALTGSFLGDFIPQLAKLIDPESRLQLPYLFAPLTDTLAILVGSLVLGVIQILTGMAISVVYKCRRGNWVDALWDEVAWWIVLAGAALVVLGTGNVGGYPVVLLVGLAMLVYGSTRKATGFGKVTALIGTVYNGVSGYFSDILSYARLMALMLAGAVVAQVFNTLGSVTGSVVGFMVISLVGNALNLALNLLGCYVHDLRLQCLEFFGRFYKEGGRPFAPMSYKTKYAEILKEER